MRACFARLCAAVLLGAACSILPARDFTVTAYNVENLFDIDGVAVFAEYAPANYGAAQLRTKVTNIAAALQRIGDGTGPDIVLLNELEIDQTAAARTVDSAALLQRYADKSLAELLARPSPEVADLPAEFFLLKALAEHGLTGYTVVIGGDRPSPAGTAHPNAQKSAVLTRFPVKAVRLHPTAEARQIVEVLVEVEGSPLYLFCNHWKSGASDPATEPLRIANAEVLRRRLDEILAADPHADILIGGDFNSQYNQRQRYGELMPRTAINDVLRSQGDELAVRGSGHDIYNLWYELPAERRGSDVYRNEWGTLIQLIVSRGLYDCRGVQYVDNSFAVARFPGLNADAAGGPVRWDNMGNGAGFSDHFPVSARFRTVADNAPGKWMPLTHAAGTEEATAVVTRVAHDAIDLAEISVTENRIPPSANLQDGSWNRKLFRVEGKVVGEHPFRIEFHGLVWEVYAPDPALRTEIWNAHHVGDAIRFYGELGSYKGRWQFVVQDRSWVK